MKRTTYTYSPNAYTVGHIHNGWRIIARHRIPRPIRWLHGGRSWSWVMKRDT